MSLSAGNFLIRKQILKFYRLRHSNRLKPVAGPPMTKHNFITDLIGVEDFTRFFRKARDLRF